MTPTHPAKLRDTNPAAHDALMAKIARLHARPRQLTPVQDGDDLVSDSRDRVLEWILRDWGSDSPPTTKGKR